MQLFAIMHDLFKDIYRNILKTLTKDLKENLITCLSLIIMLK